jgi:hypothetical protein
VPHSSTIRPTGAAQPTERVVRVTQSIEHVIKDGSSMSTMILPIGKVWMHSS